MTSAFYRMGLSVPVDHREEYRWALRSAQAGDRTGEGQVCALLGWVDGAGVPRDLHAALDWCLKAAAQGHMNAENGATYLKGEIAKAEGGAPPAAANAIPKKPKRKKKRPFPPQPQE
jgi:TPR repeat protein